MVVQVLGGTRGLDLASTAVLVRAQAARMPVGPDLVGQGPRRHGQPDRRRTPRCCPTASATSTGSPVNPVARAHPAEFIETGISAIDGLHTLVRGQKLPVFSGYGLPGLELATRIAQARARPRLRRGLRRRLRRDRRDRPGGRVRPRPLRRGSRARAVRRLHQPRRRARGRAAHLPPRRADRRGVPRLRARPARARRPRRHDQLLRGAARGGRRPRRGAGPPRLPRLHVLRPRLAVRTRRAHPRRAAAR